ncbi:hypothetical protein, partial [Halorubrum distributum]|uniref:hypothetical protein n=1 Tax=Halorubrum distributum TaxID=29283 RepID=UPI0019554175
MSASAIGMLWKMIVPTIFIFSAPLVYTELGLFVFLPYLLVWYFVMLVAWLYSTVACLFFVGLYLECSIENGRRQRDHAVMSLGKRGREDGNGS